VVKLSSFDVVAKLIVAITACVAGALGVLYLWAWISIKINAWLGLPVAFAAALGILTLLDKMWNLGELPRKKQHDDEEVYNPFDIEAYIEELENRRYA